MRQTDVRAYGTFNAKHATILHRRQRRFQTDQNEISHDPRHLGVPSGASKSISKPMVRSMQSVQLYCTDTNTVSKQTEMRFHMTHINQGVPSGASKPISKPMVRSTQSVQLYCTDANTVSKQTEMRFHMTHRSSIRCDQNNLRAYGTFCANRAHILRQD